MPLSMRTISMTTQADGRPLPTPNAKNRAPIVFAIIDSSQAAHSLNSTVLTRAISRVVL
jgi:hypothetical protein